MLRSYENIVVVLFCVISLHTKSILLASWNMDYFNKSLTTFLSLGNISVTLLSMGNLGFHHNILICVLQMNEGLLDLERHEGE